MGVPNDLTQGDAEKFYEALAELPTGKSGVRQNGNYVRAAAACGWTGFEPGAVDSMSPAVIKRIATDIAQAIEKAFDISPS